MKITNMLTAQQGRTFEVFLHDLQILEVNCTEILFTYLIRSFYIARKTVIGNIIKSNSPCKLKIEWVY
jgi:hypothetical protein